MEKIIKLIKKYLANYCLDTFKSIVFQKDATYEEWYHIYITKEFATNNEEVADILLGQYGVLRVRGFINYQIIRVCCAIDYLCNPVVDACERSTMINECNDIITSTLESERD